MKRIVIFGLCLLMMLALMIPAWAAAPTAVYTDNSQFDVGGRVSIDEQKTMMAIMDSGSITADMYNAALEGNVSFHWFKDDAYFSDGKSITLTEADRGSTFYCMVALYSDMDCTQQCGYVESNKFTVPAPATQPTTEPTTEPTTAPTTESITASTTQTTTVPTTITTTVSTSAPAAADSGNERIEDSTPWGLVAAVVAVVIGAMVLGFVLGRKKK